jgi:CheY-like chemotaxis protein
LIKEDPSFARLPVIMLTSSSHDEEVLRGYTGRAQAFMTKPIDVDSFCDILRRLENFWLMLAVIPRE